MSRALARGMAGYDDALCFKSKISDILLSEAEGVKVRSRFKENLEHEKASLFHLVREKKRGDETNVEKLLIGGQEAEDRGCCEAEVLGFYEPLFNGRQGRPQPFGRDKAT